MITSEQKQRIDKMIKIKEGKNLVMPSVVLNLGKLKLPYAVGSV